MIPKLFTRCLAFFLVVGFSHQLSAVDLTTQTFDDASSTSSWTKLADAVLPEAVVAWDAVGVTTGALDISGINSGNSGKAYIFEYMDAALDYQGYTNVTLTFDVKLSQPLASAAVHLQAEFPGLGTVNTFDLQNMGLNESTWTTLSFDYYGLSGLGAGNIFRMHFNIAAGAVMSSGGGLLIDNIVLSDNPNPPADLVITTEVCDPATEVRLTGPWWGWDPAGGPIASDNGDGTWSFTLSPAPTADMEYLLVVDGVQENLIAEMQNGGTCAPITDFANYANRLWLTTDGDITNTYGQCDACNAPADLIINAEICTAASEVRMTGPWWGWDPAGGPVATDNGDGTWTFTLSPAPTANMEYLLVLDGVQEDLVVEMQNGGTCAPITDFSSYANRQWLTTDALTLDITYGQCTPCAPQTDLFITTEVCDPATEVRMTGPWWGWDPAGGPIAADNGDGTWTFTFSPAPVANMEYLLVVDGVQEDLLVETQNGGTCAPLTDMLTFAHREWATTDALNVLNTYGQCTSCAVPQDLIMVTQVCDPATEVRLTGPWWGWDPAGGPIAADNGDGTWTFTFSPAPTENMEYLLVVDGVQENLVVEMQNGGTCAPITDFSSYANRQWLLADGYNINNTFNSCSACAQADLVIVTEVCTPATEVRMTGPWWGWDPAAGPIAADNGDGTWTFTLSPAPTENMEYLLVVDGVQENLIVEMQNGGTCAPITDFASYANREWLLTDGYNISNTYNSCSGCVDPDLIIVTEVCDPAIEVRLTGPWWGWDPAAGPVATDNGDGTWTFTLSPAPTESMEYLLVVDGVQENLIADMQNGGTCAPITDFSSYANRQWMLSDGYSIANTYGTCGACVDCSIDTDEDGLTDCDEVDVYFTDPFDADSDNDGLTDGLEVNVSGTDPNLVDTDNNGCDDATEFSSSCPGDEPCEGDFNDDGIINTQDLLLFLGQFGTTCGG